MVSSSLAAIAIFLLRQGNLAEFASGARIRLSMQQSDGPARYRAALRAAFAPIVVAQGLDLVWFGYKVAAVRDIALITPPVGMNVCVRKRVLAQVEGVTIFRGLPPFTAADMIQLALLVAFAETSLWLGALFR
ncbi:MAG: TRAP transporter large permease subunit [Beijerinckiaceae bacterium]